LRPAKIWIKDILYAAGIMPSSPQLSHCVAKVVLFSKKENARSVAEVEVHVSCDSDETPSVASEVFNAGSKQVQVVAEGQSGQGVVETIAEGQGLEALVEGQSGQAVETIVEVGQGMGVLVEGQIGQRAEDIVQGVGALVEGQSGQEVGAHFSTEGEGVDKHDDVGIISSLSREHLQK